MIDFIRTLIDPVFNQKYSHEREIMESQIARRDFAYLQRHSKILEKRNMNIVICITIGFVLGFLAFVIVTRLDAKKTTQVYAVNLNAGKRNAVKSTPMPIKKHTGLERDVVKPQASSTVFDKYTDYNNAISMFFGNDKISFAVARAESGFNCSVVANDNYGLFQINIVHMWRFTSHGLKWYSCHDNAMVAHQIWEEREQIVRGSGWLIWGAYTDKSYLRYL